jgi:hypothetical protein
MAAVTAIRILETVVATNYELRVSTELVDTFLDFFQFVVRTLQQPGIAARGSAWIKAEYKFVITLEFAH